MQAVRWTTSAHYPRKPSARRCQLVADHIHNSQLREPRDLRERWFPNGEWILLLALAAEVALFSAIAQNFFTLGNFFEVTRLSVELGLLAVALTPVIISGGIDLSVGSMMGLAAVVFGAAYQDWHLPAARRGRTGAGGRVRRRRVERVAHRPPRHPSAHRHARDACRSFAGWRKG